MSQIRHLPQMLGSGKTLAAHIAHHAKAQGFDLPTEVAEGLGVAARVDHGRWIIDCPWCPNAEACDLSDLRFFCTNCHNATVDGKWLLVVVPSEEERQLIQDGLKHLPETETHWRSPTT